MIIDCKESVAATDLSPPIDVYIAAATAIITTIHQLAFPQLVRIEKVRYQENAMLAKMLVRY